MSRAAWDALDAYPDRRPSQREAWQAGLDGDVRPLDECKLAPRIVRRQIAHLECYECGHRFTRCARRLDFSGERCPKCRGYDTGIY
jgi:Zn ribbon nucleic-acid-binding protein